MLDAVLGIPVVVTAMPRRSRRIPHGLGYRAAEQSWQSTHRVESPCTASTVANGECSSDAHPRWVLAGLRPPAAHPVPPSHESSCSRRDTQRDRYRDTQSLRGQFTGIGAPSCDAPPDRRAQVTEMKSGRRRYLRRIRSTVHSRNEPRTSTSPRFAGSAPSSIHRGLQRRSPPHPISVATGVFRRRRGGTRPARR